MEQVKRFLGAVEAQDTTEMSAAFELIKKLGVKTEWFGEIDGDNRWVPITKPLLGGKN